MKTTKSAIKNSFVFLLVLALCSTATACSSKVLFETADPSAYLQFSGHIENEGTDIRSGLFVFPNSIADLHDVEYRYACQEGILDNSYFLFLQATYSASAFQAEIERLESISCTIAAADFIAENHVDYSEDLFRYPAYIAVYNTNMSFEYALVDSENRRISYVYLKLFEGSDYLPEEYLPLEFHGKSMMDYDTNWNNQNIYYATDCHGDHIFYLD